MTLEWLPLDSLEPHPENANRMAPGLLAKLKAHIARTGRYEPLVVRPLKDAHGAGGGTGFQPVNHGQDAHATSGGGTGFQPGNHGQDAAGGSDAARGPDIAGRAKAARYQILNGHHRARVLGELGHTHARCDVWDVDDQEARVLLLTLNRLEGRDDPTARAHLAARLAEGRSAEDLARLLPEPPDAVARLLALGKPPPAPLAPEALAPAARPMTFFLTEAQHALVREALRLAGGAERGTRNSQLGTRNSPRPPSRAERLERLATWFLESRGRL